MNGLIVQDERRVLIEDVGTLVCSLVASGVYFMCALADAPFWAYGWLIVIPTWHAVRFMLR